MRRKHTRAFGEGGQKMTVPSHLGNIVPPPLKTPFLKKYWYIFNYLNYSIIYTLPYYKC